MPPPHPAPGPPTRSPLGHLAALNRDPLRFLAQCAREHGDVVELRILGRRIYLLNDPGDIEVLLVGKADAFRKSVTYRTSLMRRMFGDGVFTSEGGLWSRQRRLLHAWLSGDRITDYYQLLGEETRNTLSLWTSGSRRDIHDDLLSMTSASFGRFIIRDIPSPALQSLIQASSMFRERFCHQFSLRAQVANLLPLPSVVQFRGMMRRVHAALQEHIVHRRRSGEAGAAGDYLTHLIVHRDEHGHPLPDRLIRDELVTLFFAGAETTAMVLSWGCYLLATHPSVRARAEDAARGPEATPAPLLTNIVRETIRLYPPSWVVGREAVQACRIGGFECRPGDTFLASQWVMHRHPRHFAEPERFHPDRWDAPDMRTLPRFAYFPFGGGPRGCPGRSFAEQAAVQVLVDMLQSHRLDLVEGEHVQAQASITLKPKNGIHALATPLA